MAYQKLQVSRAVVVVPSDSVDIPSLMGGEFNNGCVLYVGEPVNGIENRLDHCSVTVSPALNPDHESIEVPDDLLRSLSIVGKVHLMTA